MIAELVRQVDLLSEALERVELLEPEDRHRCQNDLVRVASRLCECLDDAERAVVGKVFERVRLRSLTKRSRWDR